MGVAHTYLHVLTLQLVDTHEDLTDCTFTTDHRINYINNRMYSNRTGLENN